MELSATDRDIIAAAGAGLPLVPRPYQAIGDAIGLPEAEVIARLAALAARGPIKRLGIVVRHRELGYRANAMVVWDVPDSAVADVGRRMAAVACVTLCYRRPRQLPDWPYNLFCMIHGRDRGTVEQRIDDMIAALGLTAYPHAVLFSGTRFKQTGARYFADVRGARTP